MELGETFAGHRLQAVGGEPLRPLLLPPISYVESSASPACFEDCNAMQILRSKRGHEHQLHTQEVPGSLAVGYLADGPDIGPCVEFHERVGTTCCLGDMQQSGLRTPSDMSYEWPCHSGPLSIEATANIDPPSGPAHQKPWTYGSPPSSSAAAGVSEGQLVLPSSTALQPEPTPVEFAWEGPWEPPALTAPPPHQMPQRHQPPPHAHPSFDSSYTTCVPDRHLLRPESSFDRALTVPMAGRHGTEAAAAAAVATPDAHQIPGPQFRTGAPVCSAGLEAWVDSVCQLGWANACHATAPAPPTPCPSTRPCLHPHVLPQHTLYSLASYSPAGSHTAHTCSTYSTPTPRLSIPPPMYPGAWARLGGTEDGGAPCAQQQLPKSSTPLHPAAAAAAAAASPVQSCSNGNVFAGQLPSATIHPACVPGGSASSVQTVSAVHSHAHWQQQQQQQWSSPFGPLQRSEPVPLRAAEGQWAGVEDTLPAAAATAGWLPPTAATIAPPGHTVSNPHLGQPGRWDWLPPSPFLSSDAPHASDRPTLPSRPLPPLLATGNTFNDGLQQAGQLPPPPPQQQLQQPYQQPLPPCTPLPPITANCQALGGCVPPGAAPAIGSYPDTGPIPVLQQDGGSPRLLPPLPLMQHGQEQEQLPPGQGHHHFPSHLAPECSSWGGDHTLALSTACSNGGAGSSRAGSVATSGGGGGGSRDSPIPALRQRASKRTREGAGGAGGRAGAGGAVTPRGRSASPTTSCGGAVGSGRAGVRKKRVRPSLWRIRQEMEMLMAQQQQQQQQQRQQQQQQQQQEGKEQAVQESGL